MISTLIYVGSVFNVRLCSKISLCWVNTHIGVIFFPSSIKVLFLEISGFFLSILIHKLYKIDAFFSLIFVSKCRQSYEFNFKRLYWNKIFHIAVQHDASSVERASFLFHWRLFKGSHKGIFFHCPAAGATCCCESWLTARILQCSLAQKATSRKEIGFCPRLRAP